MISIPSWGEHPCPPVVPEPVVDHRAGKDARPTEDWFKRKRGSRPRITDQKKLHYAAVRCADSWNDACDTAGVTPINEA